jgi:NADPH:quinone reductase-like Zn-dependent oxidoreductase
MESVAGRYRQAIGQLEPGPKSKQHASMASSVTGDWIWSLEELCVPEYWVQNMVQTVRFNAAVTKLLRSSSEPRSDVVMTDVVEVGPHSALQRPIGEVIASLNHDVRYSSALSRFDPTARSILDLAGRLHCSGFAVQLAKVNGIVASQESKYKCLTDLPAYVFNHSQRPLKYNMATDIRQRPHFPSPLLGAPAPSWNPLEPTWRRNLNTQQFPWLVDHQINGATLFPAAGMLAVALEAAYCTVKKEPPISGICIKQATFSHPIVISTGDDSGTDIETRLRSTSLSSTEESSSYEVNIYVRQGRDWTQAFRGTVQVMHEESASSRELSGGQSAMLQEWKTKYNEAVETCRRQVKTSAIYPHLSKLGMQYGPAFQGLENVYYNGDSSAVGKINASKMQALSSGGAEFYFVHPAVLDSLIHLAWVIRTEGATSLIATSVPARLRSIWFSKEWLRGDNIKQQELRTCNTAVAHGFGGLDTSAVVVGESGEVVLSLEHLQTTMSARDHMNQESRVSKRLCYRLETKPDIDNLDSTQLKSLLHANGTPLADYLELIAHKNPGVKVLDLTADTEGSRSFFFHRQRNTPFFDTYDLVHKVSYEDIRVKYPNECSAGRIQLKTLDLESSPLLQGFALGSYDVVLFPARDLPSTSKSHALKHIRDMLRTGGKLIIIDTPLPVKLVTSAELHSSEPTQTYRPELLKKSGFVGMDVSFQQHGTEDRRDNFTVSTAQDTVNSSKPPANFVIVIEDSVGQKALASRIQSAMLSKWELKASVVLLSQISSASLHSQAYIIFLADTQRAFLGSMAREEFEKLKVLLNAGKGTFWVTKEARTSDTGPSLSMITGLARVLRSENPSRGFVTTALESSSTAAEDAEILLKVFQSFLGSDGPNETEYIVRNGVIHIQRVVENEAVDESIISKTIPQERKLPLSELETVELEIQNPGVFDSLRCVPLQQGSAALADDEVEVQVFAFGLNFKDVVIALGRLPQNKLGCECAGVITKAGRNVRLKVGTRVMMAQNGCMKTVNRCHQDLVVAIPSTLGFEEAAAIPIAGATAYYSLVEQARLQKDETVLIHSGAGATGQMCLQIALSIGAKVYTTVGSQEKREFLMWRYGLNEDQIFYSRDTSFAPSIMSATQNQGVDVVVNSLAGDRLQASWEVVAPFGRFVELGRTEIIGNSKLAMAHFAKNVSFMAVAIDDMVTLRPALVQKILSAVVEMISQDKLRLPYPLRVRPLSEAEDAFRHLMSGKSTGKLVLKVNPQDVVRAYTVQNSGKSLSPNASYLIAGGFGGLGRSAARWMVSKGARNLILLSRSGPTSASAQLLVSELQDAGVRVVARACDVASEKELSAVLSKDTEDMPPIRGCIQGTMALRVRKLLVKLNEEAHCFTGRNFRQHDLRGLGYIDTLQGLLIY